ncbi:MAG: uncharacterized protein KVP18_003321 [Porospora cf. gigantea A]|uniref:uncharacterized protein n=1 Tax=Porospora cf. gigantea A TaxID=2853593 RepID=UPI00355A5C4C|nr:MAG: hypothetical protein KVP18_003321 [Porospora cf. gigantea A]
MEVRTLENRFLFCEYYFTAIRLMQKKAPPKRKWSLTIRKNRLQRELEEMIQLVETLEGDLLEGSGMTSEDKNKEDEFMKIKRQILELVESTKDNVRSRHLLQQTQGNTVEVIQKGAQINSSLRSLDEFFQAMKEAFKRQTRLKKQFDEQQLDVRFKDMQMLKHQIEECRNLASNAAGFTENELMQMTDFRSQMEQFGIELPKGKGEYREPNAEEQGAMQRWAERDEQFDHQIDEIGQVVDRLGDIAIRIGEKADQQNLIAMDLCRQADAANEELLNVNAKVHAVLKKGGPSMHFFLKLVLTLTFLGLLGWLFNLVSKRIGF